MTKSKKVEKLYYIILIINSLSILGVTHVITRNYKISENFILKEEYLESFFMFILLLIGFVIFRLYEKEVAKNKKNLEEAFKYIGKLNVQLQEIEEVFSDIKKFPENKQEFKNIINYFSEKVISIINADWTIIRIIEIDTFKTLKESVKTRTSLILLKQEISNKNLILNNKIVNYTYVKSKQDNLGVKAFCIFPLKNINKKEKILIESLVNQVEMIYIIFSSKFYKQKN